MVYRDAVSSIIGLLLVTLKKKLKHVPIDVRSHMYFVDELSGITKKNITMTALRSTSVREKHTMFCPREERMTRVSVLWRQVPMIGPRTKSVLGLKLGQLKSFARLQNA